MKKLAIVTGATGFLGRWLVQELLQTDVYVTAVVRPGSKKVSLLPRSPFLKIIECPMEQYATLTEKIHGMAGSIFYHLAWEGVLGKKRADITTQQKNIVASMETVKAASKLGCARYVSLGSLMEAEIMSATEQDGSALSLACLYGAAKLFSHFATKALAAQLGIAHLWAVLTNAYGEFDYSSRIINTTLRKIVRRETLEFTTGTQLYDFIYVKDAVQALIAIGERGKPFSSYLIGSGHPAPLRSFVERLGRLLAPDQALLFGNIPYGGAYLAKECFSMEKTYRDTGFTPAVSFEEGLLRTMSWLKTEEQI